jgi:3-oxoacyl-(acyl-carrier-protein) synthase
MNAPLSYASIELGIDGPTAMLSVQEASGEAAIAWGADLVADGAVDVCLAGGADELGAVLHQVLREAGLLPASEARPFDPAADGAVPGEGAAYWSRPLARAGLAGRAYARVVRIPASRFRRRCTAGRETPRARGRLAPLVADAGVVFGRERRPGARRARGQALARVAGDRPVAVTAVRGALGDFGAAGAHAAAAAALAVASGTIPRRSVSCRPPGLVSTW